MVREAALAESAVPDFPSSARARELGIKPGDKVRSAIFHTGG